MKLKKLVEKGDFGRQKSAIEILYDIKTDLMNKKQNEYDCESNDGFSIYLFWHTPSINLNLYPIIQIDYNDKAIFHQEGTENPDYWYVLADKAIQKIKSKKLVILNKQE